MLKNKKMLKKREDWQEKMMSLDADKLIFIDESGASLRMASRYARAKGGDRIKMYKFRFDLTLLVF